MVTWVVLPAGVVPLQVRHGNHSVHERNHTVVMNWNKQLLPVLQQVRGRGGGGQGYAAPSHGGIT